MFFKKPTVVSYGTTLGRKLVKISALILNLTQKRQKIVFFALGSTLGQIGDF